MARGGDGNEDRQEGKRRPRHKVEDRKGSAGFHLGIDKPGNNQQALQNPGGGQNIDDRRKHRRHGSNHRVQPAGFRFCRCTCVVFTQQGGECVVHLCNVSPNHHLKLTATFHHGDHAGQILNTVFGFSRSFIEHQTQAGRAAGKTADVIFTACLAKDVTG